MAFKVKRNTINFNGNMVSIGVDIHKVSWRVTELVEGEVIFTGTLAKSNYDSFRKLLVRFEGNYVRIAYEAGPGGFGLYDMLTADGIECIVTPPAALRNLSKIPCTLHPE